MATKQGTNAVVAALEVIHSDAAALHWGLPLVGVRKSRGVTTDMPPKRLSEQVPR